LTILLKRAYEKPNPEDGKRILVERLWPRGLKKENAKIDEWLKDIAPSDKLRKWYSHDPAKWLQFKKKYWSELDQKNDLVEKLKIESADRKTTFLFGSKEEKLNSAAALKEYLES
jgi:uncharacterized protein YeaO (DUF488 family)